ncbi:MAG: CaiB/BaiF CoA-transferase family protein [Pseudomonadota bacterium]
MAELSDILVVSLEQAVAAPYAAGRLADAGARVIKVERPGGDFARGYDGFVHGQSAYFVWLNRGKESVCLDLKAPDHMDIFRRMVARADVFIQNLAPGKLAALGMPDPRTENPGLIACSISGYGSTGPAAGQKAYDLLIQAETGLSAITGSGHGPARVGVSVCDIAAGMTAFQAILLALIHRAKTGEGRSIEVSLFHAMADWMNVPYLQHRYGGHTPQAIGMAHPTIAPYGLFTCADGKGVLMSAQNDGEWSRLCVHLLEDPGLAKRPGWATASERLANRDTVDGLVGAAFARLTQDAAVALLQRADIPYGRLTGVKDVGAHPQQRLIQVATSTGEVELFAPGHVIAEETRAYGPVPNLDEHGAAIRAEFDQP